MSLWITGRRSLEAMETEIVHIGEGRYIEMTKGELPAPPPPKPKAKGTRAGKRIKSTTPKDGRVANPKMKSGPQNGASEDHAYRRKLRVVPGYAEWLSLRSRQFVPMRTSLGFKPWGRMGVPDGMRREEADVIWAEARRRARIDMENIKAKEPDILDERAEEALIATLEVMRSPLNQDMKLKAAKQVLEWTKAKPAAKTEMTVNTAEQWLASLAEPEQEDDAS